jgi:ADP-heptose:LPS heptosyltransferase
MIERRTDCRHFRGSKPCRWNKAEGAECPDCTRHDPIAGRILVIKLDAVGDVLRSTCILPALRSAYPGAWVTWITRADARELLRHNPLVDEVWTFEDPETLARLHVQQWDRVYNLDNAHPSSALAALARAGVKRGFTLSSDGAITPADPAAARWLEMACFDRVKKENTASYQEIMYGLCGLPPPFHRPVLELPDDARQWAADRLAEADRAPVVVGVNTGSGHRWPLKMMSAARLAEFVRSLRKRESRAAVVLLGGPAEREKNDALAAELAGAGVIHAGCDHSLIRFAALIGRCNAVLCGDTLALHVAAARAVPTVACFCPTSRNEIFDYDGLIVKVAPDDCDCLCSYHAVCPTGRDCINRIPVETLVDRVLAQAAAHAAATGVTR